MPDAVAKIEDLPLAGSITNAAMEATQGGSAVKLPVALTTIRAESWIIRRDLASPPASQADGDRYLVAASATGAWMGLDGRIVQWVLDGSGNGNWYNRLPAGILYVLNEDVIIYYSGSAWVDISSLFSADFDAAGSAAAVLATSAQKAQNLADLDDLAIALANLGGAKSDDLINLRDATLIAKGPVELIANTPDVSPTVGMRRLIGASPTGVWVGKSNQVAEYFGSSWGFSGQPKDGQLVYIQNANRTYKFQSSTDAWKERSGKKFGVSEFASLAACATFFSALPAPLPVLEIDEDVSLASDTALLMRVRSDGGVIDLNNHALTLNDRLSAPHAEQVFDISSGGTLLLTANQHQSICWYGAVGNNETDCSPAVNFAIAVTTAADNAIPIVVPTGQYLLKETVSGNPGLDLGSMPTNKIMISGVPSQLHFDSGNSRPASFVVDATFGTDDPVFDFRACEGVRIADIGLYVPSDKYAGIEIGGRDCTGSGAATNYTLERLTVYGAQYGLVSHYVSVILGRDCNISRCLTNGVLLDGSGDADFSGMYINNIGLDQTGITGATVGAAVALTNSTRGLSWRGGKIECNYKGVAVYNSGYFTFSDIVFDKNAAYHVGIFGDADTSGKTANLEKQLRRLQFVGNQFIGGGWEFFDTDNGWGKTAFLISNFGTDLEVTVDLLGNTFGWAGDEAVDLDSAFSSPWGCGPINSAVLFTHSGSGTSLTTLNSVGNTYNNPSTSNLRFYSYVSTGIQVNSIGDTKIGCTDSLGFPINEIEPVSLAMTAIYQNSWTDYGGGEGAGTYRNAGGAVKLGGVVKVASGYSDSITIATLPAGYRPLVTRRFACPTWDGTTVGSCNVSVDTSGNIKVSGATGTGGASKGVVLDGVSIGML